MWKSFPFTHLHFSFVCTSFTCDVPLHYPSHHKFIVPLCYVVFFSITSSLVSFIILCFFSITWSLVPFVTLCFFQSYRQWYPLSSCVFSMIWSLVPFVTLCFFSQYPSSLCFFSGRAYGCKLPKIQGIQETIANSVQTED